MSSQVLSVQVMVVGDGSRARPEGSRGFGGVVEEEVEEGVEEGVKG